MPKLWGTFCQPLIQLTRWMLAPPGGCLGWPKLHAKLWLLAWIWREEGGFISLQRPMWQMGMVRPGRLRSLNPNIQF